jgi:hypothetical protein
VYNARVSISSKPHVKLHPIAAVIVLFLAKCPSAQTSTPALPQPSPSQLVAHLAIVVQLSRSLNAKKLKAGDKVTARVIQDVVVHGKLMIPRDSTLIGHVTDVAALTKTDPRSRLAMVFESRVSKEGGALPMRGVVQALGPPLPDRFLEAVMASSSPYSPGENGHPVNGAIMSTGQTNAPTEITAARPRQTGARALEQREQALETAGQPRRGGTGPHGALTVSSRGVFGLPGLFLNEGAAIPAIVAAGRNVELKSGTQVVLHLDVPLL